LAFANSAQEPPANAERIAPQTRADLIELERERKASQLAPDVPARAEQVIDQIEQKKVLALLMDGVAGFRIHLGGLVNGSGLALGPEYQRRDLAHGQVQFRTSVRGSVRKFYLMDADLSMPSLADGRILVDLYAQHFSYPHIDYYGPGANSTKSGRTGFMLENTSFQTTLAAKPLPHFKVGLTGSYLMANVSRGRDDRFTSTDQVFTEQTTPGIQFQSNFLEGGGFVQYDWRDNPGGPRRGGNYLAQYTTYSDTMRQRYSFDRLDLEAQQYFGFFNQRRVIALRGKVEATDPRAGNAVPFYLQPTLGGSDDLRGFRPFRFYDNNAIVLNGEYRWEVFSGLDMALFVDAGRVFHDWHQINLRELETDYGFGFRFNARNNVFLRLDTAFSREGFQIWFRFNNVF
jgi:hypothetical protein